MRNVTGGFPKMKYKLTVGSVVFNILNYSILLLLGILTLYPFWYIFIYSISNPALAGGADALFWPLGLTLDNYISIFTQANILHASFISLARTVLGTVGGVFCCALFAYLLTKEILPLRKIMYKSLVITMYLSSGLIPWYIVMKMLGLKDNFLLYILPGLVSAFNVILIKTYIESISPALEESAFIDGAGYFTIFRKIIFPLSMPVIATVAIFTAVGQWNTWTDNMFLANTKDLQTLQLLLYQYVAGAEAQLASMKNQLNKVHVFVTPTSIKMTITMVVTLPIIIVYPLLQRYFTKGIMLGAVKG
jgi:putative aldouronate transport system permease protein